jgi:hypothetical protein
VKAGGFVVPACFSHCHLLADGTGFNIVPSPGPLHHISPCPGHCPIQGPDYGAGRQGIWIGLQKIHSPLRIPEKIDMEVHTFDAARHFFP